MGQFTLAGRPPYRFSEYLVPGLNLRPGATPPTFKAFRNGIYAYAFAGAGGGVPEEAHFAIHLLHDLLAGSTPTLHCHWGHIVADPPYVPGTQAVRWQVELSLARGYGAGTYPTTETVATVQTAGGQYVHHLTDDDEMPLPAGLLAVMEPDAILLGRVFRDHADAADTFANDAYLLHMDMHYQIGQNGTVERGRPYTSAGFGS